MGDEGDERGGNLDEERDQIRVLQSEHARKCEALDRLRNKKYALQEELVNRRTELQDLDGEAQLEKRRAGKLKEGGQAAATEAAISDYMRAEVDKLLQRRIPVMQETDDEDEKEAALEDKGEGQEDAGGGGAAQKVHDTVLVSYVNFQSIQDSKCEDYKVTFRIDGETTVEQLHRDACSYWGCSVHEFRLYKATEMYDLKIKPKDLEPNWKLQDGEKVLDTYEEAHLHLMKHEIISRFRQEWNKKNEAENSANHKKDDETGAEAGKSLKTFRHGAAGAREEPMDEPFVEALKPWPGVYTLLKNRKRVHDRRARKIHCRDIVIYGLLCAISFCCIFSRNSVNYHYTTDGIKVALGQDRVMSDGSIKIGFDSIKNYDDFWAWSKGTLAEQLFQNTSSMRQYYEPVGFLRFRQQTVDSTDCYRKAMPHSVQQTCYHIEVNDDTQRKLDYIFVPGMFINMSEEGSGRYPDPNPLKFTEAYPYTVSIVGALQEYSGGGYMVDYNLADQIEAARHTLPLDLDLMKSSGWINTQTRMISIDFTLANYHLQCYTAVTYLIEIAPSGAMIATSFTQPFLIVDNYWVNVAEVLDVFRGIFIIGYILLIRVYFETKRKVARGKGGLSYVFSFAGFLDQSIVAIYSGIVAMRLQWGELPKIHGTNDHYLYAVDGVKFTRFFVAEASFLWILLFRWCTFLTVHSNVYRFWQIFARSAKMFVYYLVIFLPLILALVFLSNAIWHPYVEPLSRWGGNSLYILTSIIKALPVVELSKSNEGWTLIYLAYFVFSMTLFFVNGFLAITVHAYFEVQLLDDTEQNDAWNRDKVLDWMLWGWVYRMVTGNEPGSSFIDEEDDKAEEDGEDDDEEDDEKG